MSTTSVTPAMIAIAAGKAAPESGSVLFQQWNMWITDAVMLIDTRAAELNITDPLDQAKLDYVVREAVVAQVKRPEDATQVTVSVDDASTSKTYRSGKGRVTILDEWWVLLGLTDPKGGAFSIDMAPRTSAHLPWCALAFGAVYCSCGVDMAGVPIFEGGDDW